MTLEDLIEALQRLDKESRYQNPNVIIRNGPWWTKIQVENVTYHPNENLVTLDIPK